MKQVKTIVSVLIFLGVIYLFIGIIIKDAYLKSRGECRFAVLIDKTVRVKSHKPNLYYSFNISGRNYEGNSLEEDLNRVGDSVCVIYLESFPSINRPVKYFNKGDIK